MVAVVTIRLLAAAACVGWSYTARREYVRSVQAAGGGSRKSLDGCATEGSGGTGAVVGGVAPPMRAAKHGKE